MYDYKRHHRRSVRLSGCDYSQAGAYFITICVQEKAYLFGCVVDDVMQPNEAGQMIERWWLKIPEKFNDIELGSFVVMPNHFHAIVLNRGATPALITTGNVTPEGLAEHAGSPLHSIVQWFKTMTTNDYIKHVKSSDWARFNEKLWQRNYYEHIIRTDIAYQTIDEYIINNPANWANDRLM